MSLPALFVIAVGPIRHTIAELCPATSYRVANFASLASALALPACDGPDLLIVQIEAGSPCDRLSLNALRERWPGVPMLLVASQTAFHDSEPPGNLHPCIFRPEPVSALDLQLTIERATTEHQILREVQLARRTLLREYSFTNLVGCKGSIANVVEAAAVAARKDLNVLMRGEPGTGKRLLARTIHFSGLRRNRPFVTVYCGAAPTDRLDAEIFGTGQGGRVGKAELADGGTLFLDEIGRAPVRVQEKLLRLIEERGGALDVRVIVSARRNLPAMIKDGSFREDLYYRGRFVALELPPLRDRLGDIPALANVFLKRSRQKHNRPAACLPEAVLDRFYRYPWPGNLPELAAAIDHAVALGPRDTVVAGDLPDVLQVEETTVAGLRLGIPYNGLSLDGLEQQLILTTLERNNWNQTWAARALGLTRKTLIYRMEKYGIEPCRSHAAQRLERGAPVRPGGSDNGHTG